jgi:hypothetical protein
MQVQSFFGGAGASSIGSSISCPVPGCAAMAAIDDGMFDEDSNYHAHGVGIIPPALVERLKAEKEKVRESKIVDDAAFNLLDLARPGTSDALRKLPKSMQWPVFIFIVSFLLLTTGGAGAVAINAMLDLAERRYVSEDVAHQHHSVSEEEVAEFRRVMQDNPQAAQEIGAILQGVADRNSFAQPASTTVALPKTRAKTRQSGPQSKRRRRPRNRGASRVADLPPDPPGGKRC